MPTGFEASSGLRGRSRGPVTLAASFPSVGSVNAAANPVYSSASATDSHRLPFLEGSRNWGGDSRAGGAVSSGAGRSGVWEINPEAQGKGGGNGVKSRKGLRG